MTKTIILLIVYIAWILKNMYSKGFLDLWLETPLDWLCAISISAVTPTIICGLILYFF